MKSNCFTFRMATGALLSLWPMGAGAAPEDPGTFKYQQVVRQATLAGLTVSFDLYIPQAGKPCPVVALGHGFTRSRLQMAGWGKLLASRGYVAAAPDLPGPVPDHAVNGQVMSGVLEWAATDSQQAGSPLKGLVDGSRRGVMGHSAGGLASVLAAAGNSKIAVVVGLDPVDSGGLGKLGAAKILAPVVFVRAEPHACNSQGNAADIFGALTGPRLSLGVIKGTHCDPEWDSGPLCTLMCGGTDAQRQLRFRRYAMAALDHVLQCSGAAAPYLGGAVAKTDGVVKDIVAWGFPPKQPGCGAAGDGGGAGQWQDRRCRHWQARFRFHGGHQGLAENRRARGSVRRP